MRNSRIRREIAEKGLATCIKLNLESPRVIEMAGLAGFSAVWLCREHVPSDWVALENAVRAAKIHDVDVVVRVSKGSYSDYVKPFECDAAAIMVPHVTSAGEARHIVEMCRFMPLGKRALDGGCVDGGFTTLAVDDYLEASNREKLIILQIESPEAVEVVDEIAAVEGYDFLLFGPGDYAHRIGKAGQINDPEVLEARRKVEAACLRHGKAGFSVGAQGTPKELHGRGYRVVNLGSDVRSLIVSMEQAVGNFNRDALATDAYYQRS
ncbi:MAG TPA: aldolase/citrate lyase family protein [Chthoniobacteraceae bacterium]|nr:aldolase/citrate lyase family protein [Chthoniobacteraceae bacterium]